MLAGMHLAQLTPAEQLRAGALPRRLAQLLVGLTLYGASMAFLVRCTLGMLPWDVLHYGVALHVPLSLGTVVIIASLSVLLLWVPLRQMPGLGTIANSVGIGVALDATLHVLPTAQDLPTQLLLLAAGIFGNGLATALYLGAQLGPGPRDGLMTGVSRVSGASLRLVRTGIEIVVVIVGWLLGGVVGLGTLAYALAIGPLTQWLLPMCLVDLPHVPRNAAPAPEDTPEHTAD